MVDELPRPVPIDATRPFWDGLAVEEVRLPRCRACAAWVFYPRPRCSTCLSADLEWQTVSGQGTIYSYTVARQATHPAFAAQVPQLLAIVELDEGVRITTTLVGVEPDDIRIGLPVRPVFDHGSDGITLLRFRPAAERPPPQPT
ncbi:MAG: OB-fold domain-containing protein [Ilumatobacteraceae bacterium]